MPDPVKPETCALCGNTREWHRNPGKSGVHKFAERMGDLNAPKPEATKQDRAREIANHIVQEGARLFSKLVVAIAFAWSELRDIAELAIRAYGDERYEDGRDEMEGNIQRQLALIERLEAALATEKERVGRLHRLLQRADALLPMDGSEEERAVQAEAHDVLVRCSDAQERAEAAEAEGARAEQMRQQNAEYLEAAESEVTRLREEIAEYKAKWAPIIREYLEPRSKDHNIALEENQRLREVLGRIEAIATPSSVPSTLADLVEIARLCREAKGGSDAAE